MPYSKYAIWRTAVTLETILWLIGIGAVVVALAATAYGMSPWRLFGLASLVGIVTVAAAVSEADSACGAQATASDWALTIVAALGLALYAAAALGAVIDGVRLGIAREYGPALSRALACPLASAVCVGIVLYAFLLAALHCY
jgi:hypothetical protein